MMALLKGGKAMLDVSESVETGAKSARSELKSTHWLWLICLQF